MVMILYHYHIFKILEVVLNIAHEVLFNYNMDSVITVITNNKSKDRKEDILNKSHIKTLKVAPLYTVRGMQTAAVSIGDEAFAFFFIPNTRHAFGS